MGDQPGPRQGRRSAGIRARLEREDHREMTAAALASNRHVSSMERWKDQAREKHPGASSEEITRIAGQMRGDFYREIGRRSGEARRAASGSGPPARRQTDPAWWERQAREQHPGASSEEITRIAGQMRADYRQRAADAIATARRSPMFISNPQRWVILARQACPDGTDEEIGQAAAALRAEHYQRIAEKRVARKAALQPF